MKLINRGPMKEVVVHCRDGREVVAERDGKAVEIPEADARDLVAKNPNDWKTSGGGTKKE